MCILGDTVVYAQADTNRAENSTESNQNMSEQNIRELGGFYAEALGLVFYPDPKHDNHLYAINLETKKKIAVTDFMAVNLCVVNDALYFTDVSMSVLEGDEFYDEITRMFYGGNLYRISSISNMGQEPVVEQIGEEGCAYYQLSSGEDCLYALSGDSSSEAAAMDWAYFKLDYKGNKIGYLTSGEEETILSAVSADGFLYMEVQRLGENGLNDGYILKIDRDYGTGSVEYLLGQDLHVYENNIYFISTQDSYLYEIKSENMVAKKISCCKLMSYTIKEGGHISAVCANGKTGAFLSQQEGFLPFQYFYTYSVNGWLNYIEATGDVPELEKKKVDIKHVLEVIKAGVKGKPPIKEHIVDQEIPSQKGGSTTTPSREDDKEKKDNNEEKDNSKMPKGVLQGGSGVGEKAGVNNTLARRISNRGLEEVVEPVMEPGVTDPCVAIDMLYALISGDGMGAPIFDVYDDASKEAYVRHLNDGELGDLDRIDLSKSLAKKVGDILGAEGVSEAKYKAIESATKDIISSVVYSRELVQTTEDQSSAYVRVHVTKMIDMNDINSSDNILREEMFNFINQSDYSLSDINGARRGDMLADFIIFVLPRLIQVNDVDYTFDILCTKDVTLGWVADPGEEPGKGGGQIFQPEQSGLMTGELTDSAFARIDEEIKAEKRKQVASYKGVKACKLRTYAITKVAQDRETIEQYIFRNIKFWKKEKNQNIVYRYQNDYAEISEYLPGYRNCSDIAMERIEIKPQRDYLTKIKNRIENWFIKEWSKENAEFDSLNETEWLDHNRLYDPIDTDDDYM